MCFIYLIGGIFLKRTLVNNKISMIAAAVVCIVGIVLVILTQVDFLGDLVLSKLNTAVTKQLNVELDISPLTGNPIMGLKGSGLAFVRSGDKLLTADSVEIKLSMLSLIKNSPRVSVLTLNGLTSDYESLNLLVPKKKEGAKDIPIDKIEFRNTEIASKWGMLKLDNSSLKLRGTEWFAPAFNGTIAGIPFSVNGVCKKNEGNWILEDFSLKLDKSVTNLSGTVSPSLNLSTETKELNLHTVASLVPDLADSGISGILSGRFYVKGLGRDMEMDGEGNLKDALLLGVPLSEVSAKWNYSKGLIEVEMDSGNMFKSSLTGHMKLDMRPKVKYLEVKASAKDLSFADWTDKFAAEVPEDVMFLQGGITSLSADLKGPLNALVGKIEIASSDVSYKNIDFTNLRGNAIFDGKPQGHVNFSALHKGKNMTLVGTYSLANNTKTYLKFNADSIVLDSLGDSFESLKKYNLRGTARVSALIEGLTGNWLLRASVSSSSVKIEKIGTINNLNAAPEYYFKNGSFVIKKMSGLWNGAQITGSGGTKSENKGAVLSFKGTFKNMSAEKFYKTLPFLQKMNISANASGTWSIGGTGKSPKIVLRANTSNGRFRKLKVNKFSTKMLYSSGVLTFDPMDVSAAGGTGKLECRVVLPKTKKGTSVKTKAEWEISGNVKNVDLSALNGLLKLSQDIDGPCTGYIKLANKGKDKGMQWSANISGSDVRWRQFRADGAKGLITGEGKKIKVNDIKVEFLRGKHDITGTILLGEDGKSANDTKLDLKVISKKINMYELIRRHLPVIRSVQGLIQSTVYVGGTLASPSYKGTGTLEPFRYRGFLLPMVDIDFNGSLTEINIPKANARLRNGKLSGNGRIYLRNGEWHATLNTVGSDIDMNQIGAYLPKKFRAGLGGKSSFKLSGAGKVNNFRGEGDFSSKEMKFLGIKLEKVHAPFYITGGYAVMEDVKADTNGGTVAGGLAMDLNKSIWGGNLTILSADVQSMLKQLFPNLKGKVTGKGDLKVRAGGETGRMSTVKGGGVIFMRDGAVSGFDAVEAARKYTKGKPLLFKTIQSAFTYYGGDLTILPGSQAVAPTGDTFYRYVMLDGLINKDNELSMFAMGKVNIRALNALLGALQGIIKVGMDYTSETGDLDKNALLKNFLGGILSGYTRTDFRFVSLNINGTLMSPTFSNIKVDKSQQIGQGKDVIPQSASDPKEKNFSDGNTTFKLKFEIPVGPGVSNTPSDIGGQIFDLGNVLQNMDFGN